MEEKKKVMIDAGHGGTKDPGAVFEDRMEKDDTLRLALAVGEDSRGKWGECRLHAVNGRL